MSETVRRFVNPKFPFLWHGGDYNPEQWPEEVRVEDMRLMGLARVNACSIGIFSWVSLEPEEGRYTFDWLDRTMDRLAEDGRLAALATPSAAIPAWMSQRYPEVLRVGPDGVRRRHGGRVNYCWHSPVYREKAREMATMLADRYASHPALALWHVSNEYGGACYCERCQEAFRGWLRRKYGELDALNAAYWTAFWSHTYTDWSQVEAPGGPHGETAVVGLTMDWRRFVSDSIIGFMGNETQPLRELTPGVPVTTNMMGTWDGIDYWEMAKRLDVVGWDSYPNHHERAMDPGDWSAVGFTHDIYRSMKGGRPFLLIECTPSACNWWPAMTLKRPGIHMLEGLQAVAHGSDSVMYFQWRQSRGSNEMFHGAVVGHGGAEGTRVFAEVSQLGARLKGLAKVAGSVGKAEVALLYDWQNGWAVDELPGPRQRGRDYVGTCIEHYRPFWRAGVAVDVIDQTCPLEGYKLVVAPMAVMLRPGFAGRVEQFVEAGGTFVTTYWSGWVDENCLAIEGGAAGALRGVLGVRCEELDAPYEGDTVSIVAVAGNDLGLNGPYCAREFCELAHAEGAEVLATYGGEFYAGRPALTRNRYGQGEAYYVASRNDAEFHEAFLGSLISRLGIRRALQAELPWGVTAQTRRGDDEEYVFAMNFGAAAARVTVDEEGLSDLESGQTVGGAIELEPAAVRVFRRALC